MMEIAVYGLPVRMPHWSFGVRYIYQLIQRHMGHSRLFEVVFPGNPGHAYLADEQRPGGEHSGDRPRARARGLLAQQPAVPPLPGAGQRAHRRARRQPRPPDPAGDRDARRAARGSGARCGARARAAHRRRSAAAPRALPGVPRRTRRRWWTTTFRKRFAALEPAGRQQRRRSRKKRAPVPPHPERDLLWFVAQLRAGDGELGARHLPRGARGVVLFLSGVRHADHERGLGVLLARAPAARGGFRAAAGLPGCHQVPLGRGAAGRRRAAGGAQHQSLPPRLRHVGEDRREGRAGGGAPHHGAGRRLRVRAQPPDARAGRGARPVPLTARAATARSRCWSTTCTALHEAVLGPKYNFGAPIVVGRARAQRRHAGARPTTARSTAAASTSSAAARCSTTCTGCGAARSCSPPSIRPARRWS